MTNTRPIRSRIHLLKKKTGRRRLLRLPNRRQRLKRHPRRLHRRKRRLRTTAVRVRMICSKSDSNGWAANLRLSSRRKSLPVCSARDRCISTLVGEYARRVAAMPRPVSRCVSAGHGMSDNALAEALNEALIAGLKERGDLNDPRLEDAFRSVRRHLFLPGAPLDVAYRDEAVPIKTDVDGSLISSLSQPSMIAAMLGQLELEPGQNVLEIGAGTGYSAALMQHVVGPTGAVTSIEIDNHIIKLAEENLQRLGLGYKVRIVQGDGAAGYSPRASYDRIIATASVWDILPAWVNQLKPDGILVAPIWLDALQFSAAFRCIEGGALFSSDNIPCGFVRLRGPMAGPRLSKRVGATSLVIVSNHVAGMDAAALEMLMLNDAEENYLGLPLAISDYWNGLMPFLMLNLPDDARFALYHLLGDKPAFGLDNPGFALFVPGSGCFVPYNGRGFAIGFGSSDAVLALQELVQRWAASGRPTAARLRLYLTPPGQTSRVPAGARVFERPYHQLAVWLEQEGAQA